MAKLRDITGQKINYLTVIKRVENNKHGKTQWLCKCVCGKEKIFTGADICRSDHPTKSCGCMSNKLLSDSAKTHGMTLHPAYGVWHSMKQRCNDPNHKAYHNYGGRGITVCDDWSNSFESFWNDMGPSYKRGTELDRIDNDKGYCKENCRWVLRKINARNRRTNTFVNTSKYGRTTVSELSELSGIKVNTILYRLHSGWSGDDLIFPANAKNKRICDGCIEIRGQYK